MSYFIQLPLMYVCIYCISNRVSYGVVGALTFTLLGWHNWFLLPPSPSATLIIVLNLLTILTSMLVLHLSFFGRLLALYQRNFQRVKGLSSYLHSIEEGQLGRCVSVIVYLYH